MIGTNSGVIRGVVVPNKRFAPELPGNLRNVLCRIPLRNDVLTRPKDVNLQVEHSAKISEVLLWRNSKFAGEPRIVGIVRWTNDESPCIAPSANIGYDFDLKG